MIDDSKLVKALGKFPLPIEVIGMAQSFVALELIKIGGRPVYRDGFKTDNGNIILDVHNPESRLSPLQPFFIFRVFVFAGHRFPLRFRKLYSRNSNLKISEFRAQSPAEI